MLELHSVNKKLGDFTLADLTMSVAKGEYFVILGPSGVGKTVFLEVVAGLIRPDSGRIVWDGADVTFVPPERRGFALVYQDYALFPHLNVAGNIAYGLRAGGVDKKIVKKRVQSTADLLGIRDLLYRKPQTLSGGEQQRTALARALITEPNVLLLDEPLAAVDPREAERLRRVLRDIHRRGDTIFLHVTHNVDEALYLGDKIGVMLDGTLRLVSTPEEIFRSPTDREVADFLGLRNVIHVDEITQDGCRAQGVEISTSITDDSTAHVWIRPEDILLSEKPFESSARNQFRCKVIGWEPAGRLLEVRISVGDLALSALITRSSFDDLKIESGTVLYCTFKSSAIYCF